LKWIAAIEDESGRRPESESDMIQPLIVDLLKELGEDPYREGLLKTPERVASAYAYLTSGYQRTVEEVLNEAIFTEDYDEMVVVKDIEVYSLCEHHLLPFYGKAHIAYLPAGKIVVEQAGAVDRSRAVCRPRAVTTQIAGPCRTRCSRRALRWSSRRATSA
jgi:hypothetical protein